MSVPTVTVNGEGKLTVAPDMATLDLGVRTSAATAKEATKKNAEAMDAVIKALEKYSIPKEDIQTSNFGVYPDYIYENDRQRITGYIVENHLSIKYYDLEKLGEMIDTAIAAGANESWGVSFGIKDRAAFEARLAEQAVKNARAQADAYAAALGYKLGEVVTVSTTGNINEPVVYRNAPSAKEAPAADEAAFGTSLSVGSLDLYSQVTVRFALEK